ncbi:hypothetical protein PENSUB_6478 [Penicillium subrubescens]|uniref:Uncharacterized protein n=1 Tax=Penicillium subrubescens TaxID=1316194 RepID=A0A1Q5U1X5_9EURO|nr:hypothetical protein PENSUB_6478 [Penicillium subrubescens]
MSSIDPTASTTPTNFVGWSISAENTRPVTCNENLPWATSDTYAGCAYETGDTTTFITSCYRGSVVYSGSTTSCDNTAYSCEAFQIFETEGDSVPAWTMYNCVSDWYTLNLYRFLTGISTDTASLTSPASTDAGTITAASTTFATATSSSSPTWDPTPIDNSGSTSLSGGAIAGIAVGSVAGVLLLPQSPPPWDKPELAADTGPPTTPYRQTLHEME